MQSMRATQGVVKNRSRLQVCVGANRAVAILFRARGDAFALGIDA